MKTDKKSALELFAAEIYRWVDKIHRNSICPQYIKISLQSGEFPLTFL